MSVQHTPRTDGSEVRQTGALALHKWISLDGETLQHILALAVHLARQGRDPDALTLLEGVHTMAPEHVYVRVALGCIYMRARRYADAIEMFSKVVHAQPDDIVAHAYLGELYLLEGQAERALQHLRRAVELDADGRDPYANRARAIIHLVQSTIRQFQSTDRG